MTVFANCSAQHRVFRFECVEERFDCCVPVQIDMDLVADLGQRAQVMR